MASHPQMQAAVKTLCITMHPCTVVDTLVDAPVRDGHPRNSPDFDGFATAMHQNAPKRTTFCVFSASHANMSSDATKCNEMQHFWHFSRMLHRGSTGALGCDFCFQSGQTAERGCSTPVHQMHHFASLFRCFSLRRRHCHRSHARPQFLHSLELARATPSGRDQSSMPHLP